MKSLVKLAICGLFTVAIHANAAAPQLLEGAVAAAEQSAIAATVLGEVKGALGLSAVATAADINAAMLKIGTTESLVKAVTALNAFNTRLAKGTDAASVQKNTILAKSLFTTANGEVMAVASVVNAAASRSVKACDLGSAENAIADKIATVNPVAAAEYRADVAELDKTGDNPMAADGGTCGEGGLPSFKADALLVWAKITHQVKLLGKYTKANAIRAIALAKGITDDAAEKLYIKFSGAECNFQRAAAY